MVIFDVNKKWVFEGTGQFFLDEYKLEKGKEYIGRINDEGNIYFIEKEPLKVVIKDKETGEVLYEFE